MEEGEVLLGINVLSQSGGRVMDGMIVDIVVLVEYLGWDR